MYRQIVVLTGAGISAESGMSTFRDQHGLWEQHHIEDVATPEGYARDIELVERFYNSRWQQLHSDDVVPNAAHLALAKLETEFTVNLLKVAVHNHYKHLFYVSHLALTIAVPVVFQVSV